MSNEPRSLTPAAALAEAKRKCAEGQSTSGHYTSDSICEGCLLEALDAAYKRGLHRGRGLPARGRRDEHE